MLRYSPAVIAVPVDDGASASDIRAAFYNALAAEAPNYGITATFWTESESGQIVMRFPMEPLRSDLYVGPGVVIVLSPADGSITVVDRAAFDRNYVSD